LKKIIFWGATGQSIVLEEFISEIGFQLIALFDNNPKVKSPFSNIPLHYGSEGFEAWIKGKEKDDLYCLVAIAGENGKARYEIQQFLESHNIKPITAVHPSAVVAASVKIGKGSQILSNATITARTELDEAVIVNTSASVDHESKLGKGVHIGPGAKVAGCVTIGDFSFIGTGAVVLPRITIGKNVIIGAGAVVTKDMLDNVVAYGNPAKIIRSNKDE
jgi:sugar O-acyltransferase (sialic acid O-acetyltransferase NeuD family)